MAKLNARLEGARKSYREALEAARATPTPEAWARLLAAGKALSAAEDPRSGRRGRRRPAAPVGPALDHAEGPVGRGEGIE